MRWLLALACLVSVADARPPLDPFDREEFRERKPPRMRGALPDLPNDDYETPCERSKRWSKVVACMRKSGKLTVLYELPGVKLISVRYDSTRDNATLYLYVERDQVWRRGNLYAATTPTAELLSFKKVAERPGYQLEMGSIGAVTHSFDTVTTTRVTVSRKLTTVCGLDALDCRTVMTACDAFIGGKAYWSFRGTVAWDGRALKVMGDVTNAGRLCMPPKSTIKEVE